MLLVGHRVGVVPGCDGQRGIDHPCSGVHPASRVDELVNRHVLENLAR
jgi:hypothetical protein